MNDPHGPLPAWDDCILYLAGVSWGDVPGTDHRLVRQLARHLPVLWVAPPASPLRSSMPRRTGSGGGLRMVAERVAELTPIGPPGPGRPVLRRVAELAERRAVRSALRRLRTRAVATIASSPLPRSVRWAPRPRLYYATDDFAAGATLMGMSPRLLRRAEAEQLRHCDVAAAVTEELAARFRTGDRRVEVIPNGCDIAFYAAAEHAPPPADLRLVGPVAGVVGQLSDRLDLRLLEAVADAGHALLLVGPRLRSTEADRWDQLLSRRNVQWTGARPFAELPRYLGAMRAGLTPYADSAFNRGSFPLKTLEYLAAGLPVVSSDLPASRALGADLVATAATPARFAAHVTRALAAPLDPAGRVFRRKAAEPHDWANRARSVLEHLRLSDRFADRQETR